MLSKKEKGRVAKRSLSLKKPKNTVADSASAFGEKRDISKYFQKSCNSKFANEQQTDLTTAEKIKKPSEETDDKNENNQNFSDHLQTSSMMDTKLSSSSVKPNLQQTYNTSVEITSGSSCDQKHSERIGNKNQETTKDVLSPSAKTEESSLCSPCLMQGDDFVIPPTPPVNTTHYAKGLKTDSFIKSNYSKKTPKKNGLSVGKTTRKKLTLKKKPKNSSFNSLKKGNACSEGELGNKKRTTTEIIDESACKEPVSRPTLKLARKTYKLTRNVKKSTPGPNSKSSTPLKRQTPSPKNISSILSKDEDVMMGYGNLSNDNGCLDFLDQSLLFGDDNEGQSMEQFSGGSIKRLADRGNSPCKKRFSVTSSPEVKLNRIQFKDFGDEVSPFQNTSAAHPNSNCTTKIPQPSQRTLPRPQNIKDTTPKKPFSSCEHGYDDLLDISMSSLNNEEIYELIESIPSQKIKPVTPNNKQVSPARNYVRSKSVELNSLTSNVNTTATKLFTEESDDQGYRRLLVLEVYRREILDDVTCCAGASEKVLRLFDESNNSEKYCQLREDWERTEVEHGDIVNIVGKLSSSSSYILDNKTTNSIIVHPDILVTPTAISSSIRCLRRSILEKYFRIESQNEVMFLGTLLHSIFDAALTFEDFSTETLQNKTRDYLQKLENLTELYGLGITEEEVLSKVLEKAASLTEWAKKYFHKEPQPIHGVIDFKDGGAEKTTTEENVAVCISKVVDIEECVWSPKFGLKGKVDATVEVKINKRSDKMKKNASSIEPAILPLELKTGKLYSKLGSVEHRAQVILYTLLMMDRYSSSIDTGLLVYLKEAHMLGVPAYLHEKRALVMKRNEMVRYLSVTGSRLLQNMPGMLQDQRSCNYCSHLKVCTLYHKSVENGNSTSAGMGQLFDKITDHLSPVHLEYFVHWNHLISLESKAMKERGNESDVWRLSGLEREQLGYCFSNMLLECCELPSESMKAGQFVNKFRKQDSDNLLVPISEMHLVKGDYVAVSQDKGLIALATGFLIEVSEKSVSVLLDKDLTNCYHHVTSSKEVALYRIDKAEISTGTVIQWSNLAKLFFADSEQDAKLRRLIVDLYSPRFSREKEIPSSQVSGPCSSQLSVCSMSSPVKSSQCDTELTNILNDLNSDQRIAVKKVLSAEDYALILGMPGTGKTTTIACLVRALITLGQSVLLTSYTHSAVDNILLKLKQRNVDFLRLGSLQKIHPEIQQYAVEKAAKHVSNVSELKDFYESKLVVATTCLGVNHSVFSQRSFDYCIVDEASQITQPVCFGSLRHASIFVLVGDHYQLPPLVQSHEARDGGMDISLFKRLSEHHPQAVVNLEHQYRMHKDIMLLSNSLIYDHRLKCGTQDIGECLLTLASWDAFCQTICEMKDQHQVNCTWLIDVLDVHFPVIFVNTDNLPALETRSGHNVLNDGEAALVATITRALFKCGLEPDHIGIISPYRHQLKVVKQNLNIEPGDVVSPLSRVEINTVDRYQGRDKQCVIVSFVRSNDAGHVGDLLRDWRRVNVAVTRAKHKLILVGSEKTLKHIVLFQELLTLMKERSWIYNLPKDAWRGVLP